jgi:hypothetical protein
MVKKYLVLGVLFILPITLYLFLSTGVNHFAKLPVLTENIKDINNFSTADGEQVSLSGNITILSFFGNDIRSKFGHIFNLTHKIYKPYHQFEDLQFVVVLENGGEELVEELLLELEKIENTNKWHFVFGSPEEIRSVFNAMETNLSLDENASIGEVFIVDKNQNLRGRDDDKDVGMLYGYDISSVAEINNRLKDDVKIILAEYRMALKKYNTIKPENGY